MFFNFFFLTVIKALCVMQENGSEKVTIFLVAVSSNLLFRV